MNQLLNKTKGDKVIWAVVILLAITSMLVVYSATGSLAYRKYKGNTEVYLFKQVAFISIGIMIMFFMHKVNYIVYSRLATALFLLSIPLLAYTLFFGAEINQGSRWIKLPVINMTIQTSDLAKLALFIYLSRLLSKKQDVIKDFKTGFLPVIVPVGLVCILIAPANLSTALLTGATCLMLLFIGRVSIRHLLLVIGIALIPVLLLIGTAVLTYKPGARDSTVNSGVTITSKESNKLTGRVGTWIGRVQNFIYPNKEDVTESNYQVNQAKIAIANGGWLGKGPGNSDARNFLPHPYSDFIYAIILEEYGLIGGAFILFIYLVFLFRSIKLFRRCPYAFGAFLALALSFTLVIQALTNMAVNVNLFPVTGVTLPLVSMGGSSFIFTCCSIGIILSVARNVEQLEGKEVSVEGDAFGPANIPSKGNEHNKEERSMSDNNISKVKENIKDNNKIADPIA